MQLVRTLAIIWLFEKIGEILWYDSPWIPHDGHVPGKQFSIIIFCYSHRNIVLQWIVVGSMTLNVSPYVFTFWSTADIYSLKHTYFTPKCWIYTHLMLNLNRTSMIYVHRSKICIKWFLKLVHIQYISKYEEKQILLVAFLKETFNIQTFSKHCTVMMYFYTLLCFSRKSIH